MKRFPEIVQTVLYGKDCVEARIGQLVLVPELTDLVPPGPVYDLLLYFALGVQDEIISQIVCASINTIRAKEEELYNWLGLSAQAEFNARRRAVWLAYERGLLSDTILKRYDNRLNELLKSNGLL